MSAEVDKTFVLMNLIFTVIFTFEMCVKLYGFGLKKYGCFPMKFSDFRGLILNSTFERRPKMVKENSLTTKIGGSQIFEASYREEP